MPATQLKPCGGVTMVTDKRVVDRVHFSNGRVSLCLPVYIRMTIFNKNIINKTMMNYHGTGVKVNTIGDILLWLSSNSGITPFPKLVYSTR